MGGSSGLRRGRLRDGSVRWVRSRCGYRLYQPSTLRTRLLGKVWKQHNHGLTFFVLDFNPHRVGVERRKSETNDRLADGGAIRFSAQNC